MRVVQTGSGAMTYIPSSIRTGLGTDRLIGDALAHTDNRHHKHTYIVFRMRKVE
jgi:hypothetical protein